MTKAKTKAQKRRDRQKASTGAQETRKGPMPPKPTAPPPEGRTTAVRPTPERKAKGDMQIPKGRGANDAPALVVTPDCVAALCIHPRRLTQAQENAARGYEDLRFRVRADLGISEGRSCLDMSPVGHDDGDGDEALAVEWRRVRRRLGPRRVDILDATVMEGQWPRDIAALREALDAFEGC